MSSISSSKDQGRIWPNFREFLSQQVQILQSEYLGRIQQEHIEEMKWDCFFESLNPKYWWRWAHKVDGEHPTRYSNLLLAAQKLDRWTKARDPLLPKTTTTKGLNETHSQTPWNLFPSQKVKGNCTFTAWSTTVKSNEAEEDPDMKPEEEEEAKSSAGEDAKTLSRVGGVDESVGYIVHFTNVVKLYQRKNWNCFRCGSPDHLVKDCLKDISKTTWKASLNAKEGMTKKGGQTPQKPVVAHLASLKETPRAWRHLKSSLLEPWSTYSMEWTWEHSLGQDW